MNERNCPIDKTVCNEHCSLSRFWVNDHDVNKARDSGLTVESVEFNNFHYPAETLCQEALTNPDIIEKVRQVTEVKAGRRPTDEEIRERILEAQEMQDDDDYQAALDSPAGI